MSDTTIARSGTSGALINGGRVFLTNTILAHNRGGRCDCVGPVISLGNNLIGDPTGCTIILQPTDLTGDPGLGDFTDNGTPGNGHFPLLPPTFKSSLCLILNFAVGSHRSRVHSPADEGQGVDGRSAWSPADAIGLPTPA